LPPCFFDTLSFFSFDQPHHLQPTHFQMEKAKQMSKYNNTIDNKINSYASTLPSIEVQWSILPTFYERICANILGPKKVKPKKYLP
jgi:hypothetical protein